MGSVPNARPGSITGAGSGDASTAARARARLRRQAGGSAPCILPSRRRRARPSRREAQRVARRHRPRDVDAELEHVAVDVSLLEPVARPRAAARDRLGRAERAHAWKPAVASSFRPSSATVVSASIVGSSSSTCKTASCATASPHDGCAAGLAPWTRRSARRPRRRQPARSPVRVAHRNALFKPPESRPRRGRPRLRARSRAA
jgi:hypothetical protein